MAIYYFYVKILTRFIRSLNFLHFILISLCYFFFNIIHIQKFLLYAIDNNIEDDENPIIPPKFDFEAVDYVLGEITKLIPSIEPSDNPDLTINDIQTKFDSIFNKIKDDSEISIEAKERMALELNIALNSISGANEMILDVQTDKLRDEIPPTSIYYSARAPYCVVTGSGPIGQALKSKLNELGKIADVRYIDGNSLNILPESEIKFAVKEARTIILASDAASTTGKSGGGWFSKEENFNVINEKGLKRLLNMIVKDRGSLNSPPSIRVVALCKACKESKGIASILLSGSASGDDAAVESDSIILQSKQRGFGFNVISVGSPVSDDSAIPESQSTRPLAKKLKQSTSPGITPSYDNNPVIFTKSR